MLNKTAYLLLLIVVGCGDSGFARDPECLATICRNSGKCTYDGETCVVGSDAECQQSIQCQEMAICTKAKEGSYCIRATDEDCARSFLCKDYGRCSINESRMCVARSDADCERSVICRTHGACRRSGNACVVPKTQGG